MLLDAPKAVGLRLEGAVAVPNSSYKDLQCSKSQLGCWLVQRWGEQRTPREELQELRKTRAGL